LLDVDTFYRMAERLYCCIIQKTTEEINHKVMILWWRFLWVRRWAEHRRGVSYIKDISE
jgi:hypothetical protein